MGIFKSYLNKIRKEMKFNLLDIEKIQFPVKLRWRLGQSIEIIELFVTSNESLFTYKFSYMLHFHNVKDVKIRIECKLEESQLRILCMMKHYCI